MTQVVRKRGRKAGVSLPPSPAEPVSNNGGNWLADICSAKVSSLIAVAFIVFAAGSVSAMAYASYPELSMSGLTIADIASITTQPRVLGDSVSGPIIDDTSLEAGDPSGNISAKPVNYDSTLGRWDYTINYTVSNVSGGASVSIGSFVVKSGITGSGQVETGNILKPQFAYVIYLWANDSQGNKLRIAKLEIKTPKASSTSIKDGNKNQISPVVCVPSAQSTSTPPASSSSTIPTFCVKSDSGKIVCPPRPCPPGLSGGVNKKTDVDNPQGHRPFPPSSSTSGSLKNLDGQ